MRIASRNGGVISCYDSFMYDDRKQIVIDKIKHILQNSKNEPLDCLGSYIVGATLARDDWEDVFQDNYPLLDEIAELGAELETTEDTEYSANIIHEIKEKLSQINWYNKIMKQDEQAIIARDMIQMIRENADNSEMSLNISIALRFRWHVVLKTRLLCRGMISLVYVTRDIIL